MTTPSRFGRYGVLLLLTALVAFADTVPAQTSNQTATPPEAPKAAPLKTYLVTIEIKQSHFTLDLFEHVKDHMNAIQLVLPVDKRFYDEVAVGTVLKDDFRTASFFLRGSIGSWDIKIVGKQVK